MSEITEAQAHWSEIREVPALWIKGILRAEMAKRGMTYADLAKCLNAIFIEENEKNLANKIGRGTLSAALFMACLSAMGVRELTFEPLQEYFYPTAEGKLKIRRSHDDFLEKLKGRAVPEPANAPRKRQTK